MLSSKQPSKLVCLLERGLLAFELLICSAVTAVKDTAESGLETAASAVTSVCERLFTPSKKYPVRRTDILVSPPLPLSQQPENNLPEFDPDNLLASYEIIPYSTSHPTDNFESPLQLDLIERGWASAVKLVAYLTKVPRLLLKQRED